MLITVISHKGGVGKTTTAFHLAAYLQAQSGPTLLVDGDPNRSALKWFNRGRQAERAELQFDCIDAQEISSYFMGGNSTPAHVVTDTQARPSMDDLASLAKSCDLLVIPTTPDAMSLETLPLMLNDLAQLEQACPYCFLLTCVPPRPSPQGDDARQYLESMDQPIFAQNIRKYTAYSEASLAGVPVHSSGNRYGRIAWSDYAAVGDEVIDRVQGRV